MDSIREIFTARLNKASEISGISQAELSRILKTTTNTVNRWFKGHRWPEPETVDQIAKILNVTPEWLYGGDKIEKSRDHMVIQGIAIIQRIKTIDGLQAALEALETIEQNEIQSSQALEKKA